MPPLTTRASTVVTAAAATGRQRRKVSATTMPAPSKAAAALFRLRRSRPCRTSRLIWFSSCGPVSPPPSASRAWSRRMPVIEARMLQRTPVAVHRQLAHGRHIDLGAPGEGRPQRQIGPNRPDRLVHGPEQRDGHGCSGEGEDRIASRRSQRWACCHLHDRAMRSRSSANRTRSEVGRLPSASGSARRAPGGSSSSVTRPW